MVDASGHVRVWTVPRVENAVKAAFFGRSIELDKSEDQVSLRYSDLKRIVGSTEGAVADKTLSRALRTMVGKGQLMRRPKGREVFYRLTIPPTERVAAFAKSDSDSIQAAAALGGMGDWAEGWGFYGVPDLFKEKLRKRFARASRRFRNEIVTILDRLTDETIRIAIGHARGRLTRNELWKVEDGLYRLLRLQATGAMALVRGALLWNSLETIAPGSISAWKRARGIPPEPLPLTGPWTDSHTDVLAKAIGVDPTEVRELVASELKKLEKSGSLLARFFEALGPYERDRFGRQLGAIIGLAANLTAVTRI